jgi:two-component system response regulator AtoC
MTQEQILIIDDEKNMRHMLKTMLIKAGYAVKSAADGIEGLRLLNEFEFEVILCDIKMPRMDGMTFLSQARKKYPEKTYIMMSAYGSIETAVEAMKKGCYDYISKPFKPDEVLLTLKKAEEREKLKQENLRLKERISAIEKRYSFGSMVARSEAMAHIFELVRTVAEHKTTVLITGESGTGKELVARAIHSHGSRAEMRMVSINCGGIPENLLESELFGYRKGAFTDAVRDKQGRFERADGGTVFLDEIGELPLSLQVKLLRVLQEEEITPLGGTGSKKIDVRMIAATSKDLQEEVEAERFRLDLFYRINVMPVHLPPLRERTEDIPLLIEHFIDMFNQKLDKNVESVSSEAMAFMMNYAWPGNIRELENAMERAVLLSKESLVTPAHLPPNILKGNLKDGCFGEVSTLSLKKGSKQLERYLIEKVIKKTNGNKTQAARLLEISRPILLSKLKEYQLYTK